MSSLEGKVAVVTGGNSGIGLATARAFHANGAKIVISGRDGKTLEEVVHELGHDVLAVQADVTKLSDIDGIANSSLYTANKGAIHALARALAAELIGRGIRVNTITIGPTATRLLARSGSSQAILDAQDVARIGHSPVKRLGRPEEVANVALFLASEDSSFVVGSEIAADGGWLLNTI
jgi:NAD(P)-dependent dehydrogenase (short-subunit alcohol dehydrogenase family)